MDEIPKQETPQTEPSSIQLFDGNQFDPQFAVALKQFIQANAASSASINGRSWNGISSLIINNTSDELMSFTTNDYANGITWGTLASGQKGFTCVTAGKYIATFVIRLDTATVSMEVRAKIYKNGNVLVCMGSADNGAQNNGFSVMATAMITLAVGDTVECMAVKDVGTATTVNTTSPETFFHIVKI